MAIYLALVANHAAAAAPTVSLNTTTGQLLVEHAIGNSATVTNTTIEKIVVSSVNHVKVYGDVGGTAYTWQSNTGSSGNAATVTNILFKGSDGDDTLDGSKVTHADFPNIPNTTNKFVMETNNGSDHLRGADDAVIHNKVTCTGTYCSYQGGAGKDRVIQTAGTLDCYTYGGFDSLSVLSGSYVECGEGDDNIDVSQPSGVHRTIYVYLGTGNDIANIDDCNKGEVFAGVDTNNDEIHVEAYSDVRYHYDDGEDQADTILGNTALDDQ